MRAMVIDYADDPVCLTLDKQYMFGDNILAAPILNDKGMGEVYIPEGKWTDIISGKVYEGGKFYREKYDYFGLPCLAKPNCIIPYGRFEKDFEYDYLSNAEFVIYQPDEGKSMTCNIYNTEANKEFTLTAVRKDQKVEVSYTETDKPFSVRIAGGKKVDISASSGGKIIIDI